MKVTQRLIAGHPLSEAEIVDVVLSSWKGIFTSRLGATGFQIGKDIFPKPQILGFLLHELIPLELAARYPSVWRKEKFAYDKDVVHLTKPEFSIEIKTSSHASQIFGNRSFAQETTTRKKDKSGYYIAVNFEKCEEDCPPPKVKVIRFGWLDGSDWQGQAAASGQQSRLSPAVESGKLKVLFRAD